jgi:hypothetical protein
MKVPYNKKFTLRSIFLHTINLSTSHIATFFGFNKSTFKKMSQAQPLEKWKWQYASRPFRMNSLKEEALWCIDPLLSSDSVKSGCCWVMPATYMHAIIEELFFLHGPCWDVKNRRFGTEL